MIDVRQLGTIIAFEIKTKEQTNYLNSLAERISEFFLGKGIILLFFGQYQTPAMWHANRVVWRVVGAFVDDCNS